MKNYGDFLIMCNANDLLYKIWDYYDSIYSLSSAEGKRLLSIVVKYEENLTTILIDEDKLIFNRFNDSLSELNYICRRDAFIQGIKFATEYLMEATNKEQTT